MWHGRKFPEVRVARCDYAEEILKSSKHIEKSPTYSFIEPWLGQGVHKLFSAVLDAFSHSLNSLVSGLITSTGRCLVFCRQSTKHTNDFHPHSVKQLMRLSFVCRPALVPTSTPNHSNISFQRSGEFL